MTDDIADLVEKLNEEAEEEAPQREVAEATIEQVFDLNIKGQGLIKVAGLTVKAGSIKRDRLK